MDAAYRIVGKAYAERLRNPQPIAGSMGVRKFYAPGQ
jgi:hypothetical protein